MGTEPSGSPATPTSPGHRDAAPGPGHGDAAPGPGYADAAAEPDVELNSGPPTTPRPAATVILLDGRDEALEVLLVRRNPGARFMGGAWVFPGGTVNEVDERQGLSEATAARTSGRSEPTGQGALRAAAVRELREEAGVALSPDAELVPYARWITPPEVRMRFDAWFYLALAPEGAEPSVDRAEIVDWGWYAPAAALAAQAAGRMSLAFPTLRQLQQLSEFPSAVALLDHARNREVVAVEPRVMLGGETARIVLPGEQD
jgi:8-oxo-dGTP pyrophosphatase MutT (NUDIX family)